MSVLQLMRSAASTENVEGMRLGKKGRKGGREEGREGGREGGRERERERGMTLLKYCVTQGNSPAMSVRKAQQLADLNAFVGEHNPQVCVESQGSFSSITDVHVTADVISWWPGHFLEELLSETEANLNLWQPECSCNCKTVLLHKRFIVFNILYEIPQAEASRDVFVAVHFTHLQSGTKGIEPQGTICILHMFKSP